MHTFVRSVGAQIFCAPEKSPCLETPLKSEVSLHAPLTVFSATYQTRTRHRSLACAWLRVHAGSLTAKMPSNPARNLARAVEHQRQQEQHAVDSSLRAAMALASDESPGGEGTMKGGELRGLGGFSRMAGRIVLHGFFSDGRPNCVTRVFLGWPAELCYTRYLVLGRRWDCVTRIRGAFSSDGRPNCVTD